MTARAICILGGTGFVGRSLGARLSGQGREVRVLTRDPDSARRLLVLPTIDVRVGDPHDEETLARHLAGVDAVVNLVGILHEKRGATFQSVHAELPRKVANACRAAGVPRLVHMSALGASESAPSEYQRSKARGEAAVRAGAPGATILRPSLIFGVDGGFVPLFSTLVDALPVIALARARARFAPVWVEDVARAVARAVDEPWAAGKSHDLCGPRVYELAQIVELIARLKGRRRAVVALPDWAGQLQAAVLEHLPGKLITRDNLRSMSVDNVCTGPFPEALGFRPACMEAIVPGFLADARPRGRYDHFRNRAGR